MEGELVAVERDQRSAEAAVLRRIWRLHFWVGLFAAPALVVLGCTGLIILYTQPLDRLLDGDPKVAAQGTSQVPLDEQLTAGLILVLVVEGVWAAMRG